MSEWISSKGKHALLALSKGNLIAFLARHCSHTDKSILSIDPKRQVLANLFRWSYPMCLNSACYLTSFIEELLLEFPVTKTYVVLLNGIVSNIINLFDRNPYP